MRSESSPTWLGWRRSFPPTGSLFAEGPAASPGSQPRARGLGAGTGSWRPVLCPPGSQVPSPPRGAEESPLGRLEGPSVALLTKHSLWGFNAIQSFLVFFPLNPIGAVASSPLPALLHPVLSGACRCPGQLLSPLQAPCRSHHHQVSCCSSAGAVSVAPFPALPRPCSRGIMGPALAGFGLLSTDRPCPPLSPPPSSPVSVWGGCQGASVSSCCPPVQPGALV